MNKNRVTPTIVGDDSASKRKVFFANLDNAGHQGGNATSFARTETGADCFVATKKQKRKLLKIIGASSLAFFMGIGTLCGVLIAPMGATSASNAGDLAALAQSADRAQEEWSAGIMSGNLNLDPENDPVVWVTDNGFEIKSHNVSVSSGTTTVSTVSYKYVTLGSWNWIIIGYSTKSLNQSISGVVNVANTSYSDYISITDTTNIVNKLGTDTTDAGSIIKSASLEKNARIYISGVSVPTKLKTIFTNAVGNTEIPYGCVLCLCAGTTGTSIYEDSKTYKAYFPGSDLDTAMTTVYNSISSAAGGAIQSTSLTTYWYNGSAATKYTHSEYLFPLACSTYWSNYSQNYCVETYLNSDAKRNIDFAWWLRSGYSSNSYSAYFVNTAGGLYVFGDYVSTSFYVRPAFVLKLY